VREASEWTNFILPLLCHREAQIKHQLPSQTWISLPPSHLCDVVQVLQRRRLAQVDAVRNIFRQQERRHQVVDVARLACSRCGINPQARKWIELLFA